MNEERHKIIVIPISYTDDKPKFLTVRDMKFKEWTFISGGCKKREIPNPLQCALRELEEETRGLLNINHGRYKYFTFDSRNRSKEELVKDNQDGIIVSTKHHVYIIELKLNKPGQDQLVNKFNYNVVATSLKKKKGQPVKRTYDENDMLLFETLENFSKRKNMWEFIRKNILKNSVFYHTLNTSNWLKF